MTKQYRLIWFQHFHKAAGTNIVNAARNNDEVLFPNQENGNPVDQDGMQLDLWNYPVTQLNKFVDDCEQQGITFIATEWGLPNLGALHNDPRVVLISCLRNPLDRFVSNFYFDLYHGFTSARNLHSYVATRNRTITMFNYYCRILSGHNNATSDIEQIQFERALSALRKFDFVLDLTDGITPLANYLSWQLDEKIKANEPTSNMRQLVSLILRGHWKLLYLRLKYPRNEPDEEFSQLFKRRNNWDTRLINEIKSIPAG